MATMRDARKLLPATLLAAIAFALPAGVAAAAEVDVGVRAHALRAEPNLYGFGITLRRHLADSWFIDATLDRHVYEQRETGGVVVGPAFASFAVGAAIGRRYRDADRPGWFWSWGIAAGLPGGHRDAAGGRRTDAGTEIHMAAAFGGDLPFAEHWLLTGALRVERHYVDWRTTSADGTLMEQRSSLTPAGVYLAISYRF